MSVSTGAGPESSGAPDGVAVLCDAELAALSVPPPSSALVGDDSGPGEAYGLVGDSWAVRRSVHAITMAVIQATTLNTRLRFFIAGLPSS